MARRLGLAATVERSLHELFERWDGTGVPQHLAGDAISLPARLTLVASAALSYHRLGGLPAALAVVRRRAGPRHGDAVAVAVDHRAALADRDRIR